jgi:hypothetical protein
MAEEAEVRQEWQTLSDVDPQLTPTLEAINSMFFERYEVNAAGGIVWGVNTETPKGWGRAFEMDTGQLLQIRYTPSTLPFTALLPGAHGLVSVRISDRSRSDVANLVLFPIVECAVGKSAKAAKNFLHTAPTWSFLCTRAVGCRLLHVLTVAMFQRHRQGMDACAGADTGTDQEGADYGRACNANTDALNCHCLAAHTISVTLKKKSAAGSLHMAAPGASPHILSAQLAGISMEDPRAHICASMPERDWETMNCREHRQVLQVARQRGVPETAIFNATAAAEGVISLVEADGLLGFLANPFFKDGALPDRLHQANGMPLLLAFATRLAMRPEQYGCSPGTLDDQQASTRLRRLFESGTEPLGDPSTCSDHMYPIDLAIRAALRASAVQPGAVGEMGAMGDHLDENTKAHKVFWHRVGQRLVTALWGLGVVSACAQDTPIGAPWRMKDEMAGVHERVMLERGVTSEGGEVAASDSTVGLAYPTEKRMALLRLHADVSAWLRTGIGLRGERLSPPNSARSGNNANDGKAGAELPRHIDACIKDADVVHWWKRAELRFEVATADVGVKFGPPSHPRPSPPVPPADRQRLYRSTFCAAAVCEAVDTLVRAFHKGTTVHMQWHLGYYLVGPHELQKCIHCGDAVHVLSGMMLAGTLRRCMVCQAHRCMQCAKLLAADIKRGESPQVHCAACGSPATLKAVQAATGTSISVCGCR